MSSLGRGRRPEGTTDPASYYDEGEARKYDRSSRMRHIQREITNRAVELLALPAGKSCYILDIGCGSGLSGLALEKAGHHWVGCDISPSMLEVARRRTGENENEGEEEEEDEEDEEDEEEDEDAEDEEYDEEEEGGEEDPNATSSGDLLRVDMGQGLPFRPASFDGAVSVSALQWLCYSDASDQDPKLRLNRFFSTLYSVLKRDAKAILQFYPENGEQAHLIAQAASKVGFAGGLLIDYPNSSKAKKYYLCLSFERAYKMPTALGTGGAAAGFKAGVDVVTRQAGGGGSGNGRERRSQKKARRGVKTVDWIMLKKERQRKQGKTVKGDSKYTGRKRSRGF